MRIIPSLQISDWGGGGDCFDLGTDEKEMCPKILLLKQGIEDRRDLFISTA